MTLAARLRSLPQAAALRERWQKLAPREKAYVAAAAGLLLLALLWWVLVAPALATLRGAEAQHRALDAQLQRMLALQSQAQAMQSQPRQNADEALRALEASVRQMLGAGARMVVGGDRVTLTVSGVRGDALAQWLTQARVNARSLPAEARLNRNANGLWDGTLVLALPPR
ncbi:type II secretion system protein GspM [Ramlibacter tataouinensis]|uniref:Candidate general secretion pathway protein M, component of type II secretion system n=1 Tax=Ramlibacter tataouinensis (strain ATCC BAA-407 / DSM 14655 / LMG 21543 / TTB310) TaxID=365046 RepID=F5Y0Q8_RAMTT|nr:type II secretion system protein GspM [Ramlibacter tataouinensis]AEG94652.1 candidate general secretion pathway protein M, component of type II secretion system [Ramlibacter tataouinensis TTB310]